MKSTVTIDEAIDTALRLPSDQLEMFIDILRNRQIDARRQEIADDARHMIACFRQGQLIPQCAADVISELHAELESDQ